MPRQVKREPNFDPAVDTYIDRAKPFAIPVLVHLRTLVHRACPEIEESIKWSRPFFSYRGVILCNMSAFTHHCSLGFWGEEMAAILRADAALKPGAMGSLGRVTSVSDLPDAKLLAVWVKQAAAFVEAGTYTSPMVARHRVAKAERVDNPMPADFAEALSHNARASAEYVRLSPSQQREYVEWVTTAKRAETRSARIAQGVTWIADGKQRHWKYQK